MNIHLLLYFIIYIYVVCAIFSAFQCTECIYFYYKNKRKCLIKNRKEGKISGRKDVITHGNSNTLAGDISESFRHLEYCILYAMTGGLVNG